MRVSRSTSGVVHIAPRAVEDLESLSRLPPEMLGCHIDAVTPGDVQGLIDELSEEGRSASRIGSIVNALRALYRYARERELTSNDPARNVRLPLVFRTANSRIATPAEFHDLLKALWERTPEEVRNGVGRDPRDALGDALPYALAAYATSSRATRRGASPAGLGGRFLLQSRFGRFSAESGWRKADRAREGSVHQGGFTRAAESRCEACKEEFGAAGKRRGWSRSAFMRRGTPPPPGSTTPASRRRSAHRSWATRRRSISPGLLGSLSSATPMYCQASWSMPGSASMGSLMSDRNLKAEQAVPVWRSILDAEFGGRERELRANGASGADCSPRDLDISFP